MHFQNPKKKYWLENFKIIVKITTAAALKAKKFKAVAEAVEKIQKMGIGTEKELLYFLFTTDSNTSSPSKKTKISQFGWLWSK